MVGGLGIYYHYKVDKWDVRPVGWGVILASVLIPVALTLNEHRNRIEQVKTLYPNIDKRDCEYLQHPEDNRFYLVCPGQSVDDVKQHNDEYERKRDEDKRLSERQRKQRIESVTKRFRFLRRYFKQTNPR
ncbi:hypothetical protein CAL7716_107150 (plasmid) [Calothrix sp. PCC 7716]|nr:hypothetical protein CAL7716_107150 [Calothrix sp. PCC 7716]